MIVNWFVNFQKKHNLKILAFPIYKKGTQWASLTGECVELLLKNRDKVLSSFRFAKCPDEHYKQTVLYNELKRVREQCDYQQLQNSLNNCDEDISQAARFIDWSRGTLNFTTRDWNRILESKDMFCRKIADKDLAAMIFGHFGPQQ